VDLLVMHNVIFIIWHGIWGKHGRTWQGCWDELPLQSVSHGDLVLLHAHHSGTTLNHGRLGGTTATYDARLGDRALDHARHGKTTLNHPLLGGTVDLHHARLSDDDQAIRLVLMLAVDGGIELSCGCLVVAKLLGVLLKKILWLLALPC
jgi:hypothetical protein